MCDEQGEPAAVRGSSAAHHAEQHGGEGPGHLLWAPQVSTRGVSPNSEPCVLSFYLYLWPRASLTPRLGGENNKASPLSAKAQHSVTALSYSTLNSIVMVISIYLSWQGHSDIKQQMYCIYCDKKKYGKDSML